MLVDGVLFIPLKSSNNSLIWNPMFAHRMLADGLMSGHLLRFPTLPNSKLFIEMLIKTNNLTVHGQHHAGRDDLG